MGRDGEIPKKHEKGSNVNREEKSHFLFSKTKVSVMVPVPPDLRVMYEAGGFQDIKSILAQSIYWFVFFVE